MQSGLSQNQLLVLIFCIRYFSSWCLKMPNKSKVRRKGWLILIYSLRVQSFTVGQSQWKNVGSHVVPIVMKQTGASASSVFFKTVWGPRPFNDIGSVFCCQYICPKNWFLFNMVPGHDSL